MGLTKSPAGVPWSYGIDRLIGEETRIYTDRLVEAWARDSHRRAVLEESRLPSNAVQAAWKTAAVALWGHACEEIQASAGQAGWSVRQIAAMHTQAYKAVDRMPFAEWTKFMIEAVIPTLREGLSGSDIGPADEVTRGENLAAFLRMNAPELVERMLPEDLLTPTSISMAVTRLDDEVETGWDWWHLFVNQRDDQGPHEAARVAGEGRGPQRSIHASSDSESALEIWRGGSAARNEPGGREGRRSSSPPVGTSR